MFLCITFFYRMIVKHETHHLYDFIVTCNFINVNRDNFDQEQCTVNLIQPLRAYECSGAEKNTRCICPAYTCSLKPA